MKLKGIWCLHLNFSRYDGWIYARKERDKRSEQNEERKKSHGWDNQTLKNE